METGKVKWFNNAKGFGFIEQEGQPDIFAHYTEVQTEGYKSLAEGEDVTFEKVSGERGVFARNITRL